MANDRNLLDDMDLSGDYGAGADGFSLESILAEFKGSAFMDGDRKTPPDELQRKTDDIIREVMGAEAALAEPKTASSAGPETAAPAPASASGKAAAPDGENAGADEVLRTLFDGEEFARMSETRSRSPGAAAPKAGIASRPVREAVPAADEPASGAERGRPQRSYADERAEPAYDTAPEIDLSVFDEPEGPEKPQQSGMDEFLRSLGEDSFDTPVHLGAANRRTPAPRPSPEVGETEKRGERELYEDDRVRRRGLFSRPDRAEPEDEEDEEERAGRKARSGKPRRGEPEEDFGGFAGQEPEESEEYDDYLDVGPEPDFKKAAAKYARRVPALRFRLLGASLLVILMLVNTWLFTAGKSMPLIGGGARANTASLLIMELLVMAVGMEVLIRGLEDILTFSPGVESLVFVSCLLSVIDGFVMLLTGDYSRGLPMAVVSAISLLGALSARKSMYMAYCDCLRGAAASSSFYGVAADSEALDGRRILKKVSDEREGFYMKLTTPDMAESLYDDLAPLLVIVSFALAFLASVGRGNAGAFTHTFSILTAVSAAFPAAALFALPFKYAAAAVKRAGGALAGYAGARDAANSDGALITDLDIFPVGSIRLENVKLFEGVDRQRALASSASLLISSGSGPQRVFEELLKSQGLGRRRVDDFTCYEGGGIGGLVDGERVLAGTGAFMNLMGLRAPEALNVSGNVFAAINDELVCVYTLSYTPASSVQSALVSLMNTRTSVLMAVRDFNVTPNTIRQRFKVSMDGVEYLPIDTAYALSQDQLPDGCGGVCAVLCRGGLAPYAEVITRSRLLKLITGLNTAVNSLGTGLSLVIMFFLCWSGAFASASALNITLFMSVIGIAVYIMSQGVKKRMK